jgi:hypothetical protein
MRADQARRGSRDCFSSFAGASEGSAEATAFRAKHKPIGEPRWLGWFVAARRD